MKTVIGSLATCLFLFAPGIALSADPHSPSNPTGPTSGRPSQSCQVTTMTPGNAANAPGSPFDPTGHAGTVYAGAQPQNSKNGQAAQYDVACFQNTTNPMP
jgi:hypothetical protein